MSVGLRGEYGMLGLRDEISTMGWRGEYGNMGLKDERSLVHRC